mmetsp:Transcript_5631/g.4920  ORF Transcript_5631/g.4920 Transcript_5631/m.4920 type:complete len:328 (+) Transcript_5631:29-1012(+)|eukprot:CAMPEP_0201571650 /NCGR_PEP_ID=MMETSP0190_2-20130828/14532_1 /ASSEMBLY_ACC=CAM_ASM_000263 /TAXON_ID=37353 /ORGANISM="Rosalina sp." /LENGTH=327 /DNA_ID=CAMNT_0047996519 /DNA_START=22 /DNA_END=1005 /DNA_ORIENTATION=-
MTENTCIEYFSNKGTDISTSEDSRTIKKSDVSTSNSFGSVNINSMDKGIYKWTIKVNKVSNDSSMFDAIGVEMENKITSITSKDTIALGVTSDTSSLFLAFNHFCGDKNSFNYGYWSDGQKQNKGWQDIYGKPFTTNDIITIKLDTFNKTIEFFHNNTSQGISDNIECSKDICYRLAIFMRGKDDSVTIQKFEKIYLSQDLMHQIKLLKARNTELLDQLYNHEEEEKNNNTEDLVKKMGDLKLEIDRLEKEKEVEKRRFILTYQAETELIRKNKGLQREIESLTKEKHGYEKEKHGYEKKLNEFKSQRLLITVALGSFVLLRYFKLI